MSVGELEELLSGIHDKDMPIVLEGLDGDFRPVCFVNSKVIEVEIIAIDELLDEDEESEEEPETETLLLLAHCTCDEDECDLPELGEVNSQPELN